MQEKQETAIAARPTSASVRELVAAFKDRVVGFVVETPEHHADAQEFHRTLQTAEREWDEARLEEKRPHLDAARRVDEEWGDSVPTIRAAKEELGRKILGYERDVRERREKAEREAERARLEAEAAERARLEREAQKAEKKDRPEVAAELRDQAAAVVVPYVPPPATVEAPALSSAKGTARPKTWSGDVRANQLPLLTRAVEAWNSRAESTERLMPGQYWQPNQELLDKFAQVTEGAIPVDGVVFKSEEKLSSRRRR